MQKLSYTITVKDGLNAPNAGALAKELIDYSSLLTISKDDKIGNPRYIFNLLSLSIKEGDDILFTVEGEREKEEVADLEAYLTKYL